MKRIFGLGVLGALLTIALPAVAQTPQATDTRPAVTTASGDTGLFFVPTGEVLPDKRWSFSFYRTNADDGQGFSDISHFPVTFGYGIRNHFELFGAFNLITRIDRDTRPLFFASGTEETTSGTGGGLLLNYPLHRNQWTGNQIGDFWLGGKINLLSQADQRPLALAIRPMIKLPTGSKDDGASSGEVDFAADAVVSQATDRLEFSAYGGMMMRGNPEGYSLSNGLRWGFGAGFPQVKSHGFLVTTELFGESYFNKTITGPAGQLGADGSAVPISTTVKSPVMLALGLSWQAPKGFFVGASWSWNLNMSGRADAQPTGCIGTCPTFTNEPKDTQGLSFRIGYHPGARKYVPPPPPPVVPPPVPPPPPPPAPTNVAPTVRASCDPCTVEAGKTATVTADAQDPDGDALTYRWTAPAGTISSPTTRQTPWTAPTQLGPVQFTVTVDDGHGHTATANTTITVVQPTVVNYTFEDVHFDFDRYTLLPDALRILDEAVTAMRANATLRLEVEGHTCNIGTAEYNLALGERRAAAVRDYLVTRGITADRLRTVSYGEERPKFDNSREETRRLNRRAALVVNLRSE